MKIRTLIILFLCFLFAPFIFKVVGVLVSFILILLLFLFIILMAFYNFKKPIIFKQEPERKTQTQSDVVDVEFKTKELDE